MKQQLLIAGLMTLISTQASAGIKTRILHIDAPENMSGKYEVLVAKNMNTLSVDSSNSELIKSLYDAQEYNSVVDLGVEENQLKSMEVIEQGDNLLDFYPGDEVHPMSNYTPSNVDSMDLAKELFDSLKDRTKWFTQCFNRAHIWAKQMYNSHQVESMKILIYYTKKYRREIKGKWWFHIAPMIDVNGEHVVLDKEFFRGPVSATTWEKKFTSKMEAKGIKGYRCKVIKNIKEFYDEENQKNEYCNIQVASMYYWEPNDMSRLDKTGQEKTEFINWELKSAAKEVFWRWKGIYNSLKD